MTTIRTLAFAALTGLATLSAAQAGPFINLPRNIITPVAGNKFIPQANPQISALSCVDLAVILTQTELSDGRIGVTYGVRNVSSEPYSSGANQQLVQVLRNNREVAVIRFANLAPGNQTTRTEIYAPFEFPATYDAAISFDPDIHNDGNTSNDDCRRGNNRLEMTTAR